jgi:hypothetical protein
MRIGANTLHRAKRTLILGTVTILAAQLAFVPPIRAEERDWQAEVAAIPATRYARDAKQSISESL